MQRYPLTVEAISDWVVRHGGRTAHGDGAPEITVLIGVFGQKLPVRVRTHPKHPVLTVAIVAPFAVTPERHQEVALATAAANASILMGTWVLLPSGELFYRVALPTLGVEVDDHTLADLLRLVVGTVQAAAPSFHAVANEGASHDTVVADSMARAKQARGEAD